MLLQKHASIPGFFLVTHAVCMLASVKLFKFRLIHHENEMGFTYQFCWMDTRHHVYPKYLYRQAWAKRVDPDQMQQNAASDQALHSLPLIKQSLDIVRLWYWVKVSEYLGKCGNDLIESMMFTKGTALFPIMQSLTTQFVQVVSIFIHAIFQLQVKRVIMNSKGPDWPVYSCSLSYLCSLTSDIAYNIQGFCKQTCTKGLDQIVFAACIIS